MYWLPINFKAAVFFLLLQHSIINQLFCFPVNMDRSISSETSSSSVSSTSSLVNPEVIYVPQSKGYSTPLEIKAQVWDSVINKFYKFSAKGDRCYTKGPRVEENTFQSSPIVETPQQHKRRTRIPSPFLQPSPSSSLSSTRSFHSYTS